MLLDVCDVDHLPANLVPAFHAIRAGLLLRLERHADASLAAREGLNQASEDKLLESVLWERLAVANSKLGLFAEAEDAGQRSLALRQQLLQAGDPGVVKLFEQTAAALRREGREAEAAEIERQISTASQ